ncbi:nucleoside diphosphate kinase homolog 5-like [Diachasma alloeum]|uniref:nucleoside diphosphate kinase homolog 5-like n=1 Tax=Diachasma alloeum TaxID=454923 RepID=UPI0010FAD0D5|nr:nucleoside diphosphate kinase homolog 5-like [Diachasma alloeum]
MCSNFLAKFPKQLVLENLSIPNDDVNERKEPSYAIIHCKLNDLTNVETPESNSNSSDPALLLIVPNNSVQVDTCVQCNCDDPQNLNAVEDKSCQDSESKFNVIATRTDESSESYSQSDDGDEKSDVECTLAIIKPGALEYKNAIRKRIIDEGFEICAERTVQLTLEQAAEFYSKEYGKLHFPLLAVYLSSGPIEALVLAKSRGVREWRKVMGPEDVKKAKLYFPNSIRAIYGGNGDDVQNVVHGSLATEEARDEILFFFPNFIIEPMLPSECIPDYFKKSLNPVLIDGLAHLEKEKPAEPLLWLANWLMENDPDKPKIIK